MFILYKYNLIEMRWLFTNVFIIVKNAVINLSIHFMNLMTGTKVLNSYQFPFIAATGKQS